MKVRNLAARAAQGLDGVTCSEPFPFSMAFQPIVDVVESTVFGYEALVRNLGDASAVKVLSQVNDSNRYAFDQSCRLKAVTLAAKLGLCEGPARLAINFMPTAVYSPSACIQMTLEAAALVDFPVEKLLFKLTEKGQMQDSTSLRAVVEQYRQRGLKIAINNFGGGHSEFNLLADFPCDYIKLDMGLTRCIHERPAAWTILHSLVRLARTLGSEVIAEGVELEEDFRVLRNCGIRLMQGYLFARPAYEALPNFRVPSMTKPLIPRVQLPAPGIVRPSATPDGWKAAIPTSQLLQ